MSAKFDLLYEPPASTAQLRYIRTLYEVLDRVHSGAYAAMDLDPMTAREASTRIAKLQAKLKKGRR